MPELTVRLFITHPWVASFCAELLSKPPGIRIVCDSARFDVGIVDSASFDCLSALPRGTGCEKSKMLVLLNSAGEDEYWRWVDQGADGVLAYGECAEHLARAVHNVAGGQIWAPPEVLTRLILAERERHSAGQFAGLMPQETAVARRVLAGFSNQEIGDGLHISLSTVKSHIASIYRKDNIHSRAQFISLAAQFRAA